MPETERRYYLVLYPRQKNNIVLTFCIFRRGHMGCWFPVDENVTDTPTCGVQGIYHWNNIWKKKEKNKFNKKLHEISLLKWFWVIWNLLYDSLLSSILGSITNYYKRQKTQSHLKGKAGDRLAALAAFFSKVITKTIKKKKKHFKYSWLKEKEK